MQDASTKESKSVRLTATVPRHFEDKIKMLATKKHVSHAWIIREALRVFLNKQAEMDQTAPN